MDVKSLEYPTVKVPYEILNKKFRITQKIIDREVNHVIESVRDLDKTISQDDPERNSVLQKLEVLKQQLIQVKNKSVEAVDEELSIARTINKRIDHLKEGCCEETSPTQMKKWRKLRLDRMLVEYFLRTGYYDTAIQLSNQSGIGDLTNIDIFLVAREVEESLLKGDITKCLAWCHENKSRLRKMESSLEFNVRLQEFIELVKKGEKLEAVKHAKKYLATEDRHQLGTTLVQQGMALLALPLNTTIQPYKDLLDPSRWQALVHQFRLENYRLHHLSSQSVLSVALQAGLSSLKTPHCDKQRDFRFSAMPQEWKSIPCQDVNVECPVCHPGLNTLAGKLPYAHCSQSKLVCYISNKPLNEHNVPMMLPNGYVYGEQALMKMVEEHNGRVICPRTKEVFNLGDLEKVYVM